LEYFTLKLKLELQEDHSTWQLTPEVAICSYLRLDAMDVEHNYTKNMILTKVHLPKRFYALILTIKRFAVAWGMNSVPFKPAMKLAISVIRINSVLLLV